MSDPVLHVRFCKTESGTEPVRDWLRSLPAPDRKNHWCRPQNRAVRLAVGNAAGAKNGAGYVGGAYSSSGANCAHPVYYCGWRHGAVAWFHQEIPVHADSGYRIGAYAIERYEELDMKKHLGSTLDDFLAEDGTLEESIAVAVKRVIAWQIEQEMTRQKLTKSSLAKKMHTSRAALDRLLDRSDTSLTLITLASAAGALGRKLKLELVKG